MQLERRTPVARIVDDVERVHLRAPQGHLDLDPLPRQPVGALTADLDRRGGRDRQLDLAAEAPRAGPRARPGAGGSWRSSDLALRVAGRGRRGEVDVGQVALVQARRSMVRGWLPHRTTAPAARSRTGRACRCGRSAPASGGAARRRARTTRARPACRAARSRPGSTARGGTSAPAAAAGEELAADELDDLLERPLAREARRLPVAAAARLARDRRDVDLVAARAERDAVRRPARRSAARGSAPRAARPRSGAGSR